MTPSQRAASAIAQSSAHRVALNQSARIGRLDALRLSLSQLPQDEPDRQAILASALLMACSAGSPECVELLLSAGANPNGLIAPEASRPLVLSCCRNNLPCVEALLNAGADTDLPNGSGRIPLSCAVYYPDITRALVSRGAQIDAIDWKMGSSSLPLCFVGSPSNAPERHQSAAILIQAGANVLSANLKGETPLSLARLSNDSRGQALLESFIERALISPALSPVPSRAAPKPRSL